jgi:hypothetical protein
MVHSELREIQTWGSYGKNGNEPLTIRLIKDLSDEHLEKIIEFINIHENFYSSAKQLMLNEREYRRVHNIYVKPYFIYFKFFKRQ